MTLTPDGYRKRLVDDRIKKFLKVFGAVSIDGPKWVGKTWSAENASNSEFKMNGRTGAIMNLDLAKSNPDVALKGESPHLIDEWQDFPEIWDLTRIKVDSKPDKGRFILTGSSVPRRGEYLHSGAGRMGMISMRTMSLYESGDSNGHVSLKSIFEGEQLSDPIDCGEITLERLIDLTIRGGWPGNLETDTEDLGLLAESYLDIAIDDACHLSNGPMKSSRDLRKMRMLVKSLARNESTTASISKIMKDMKESDDETISKDTYYDYVDSLDRIHLISDTPSFRPNVRSDMRIGKSPKRHLTDVSLAIAALGLDRTTLSNDLNTFGFMFESLCEHDLELYAEADGGRLFHYRDGRDREVDAVVELKDGRWGAFEIKVGYGQVDKAAENLLKINKIMENEGTPASVLCVICGMTRYAFRRPDGVYVVPITALGP